MNSLLKAYWIAKGVGWDNVPRRLRQSLMLRSGLLRRRLQPKNYSRERSPLSRIAADSSKTRWLERSRRFMPVPSSDDLKSIADDQLWKRQVTDVCTDALNGSYPFFSHWTGELGWPPDFNLDPVNKLRWPVGRHWLDTARSGPPFDDIKLVWEPSRFTLAFHLAREYVRSGDERWAEAFWQMIDAWIAQNPVNESVAWACGQETAFRTMAMLTGAFCTLTSTSASDERLASLELLCWQAGRRISDNLNYALSQKNNHGLSEALGLWTVGILFPEFPESDTWTRCGEKFLVKELDRQVYDDGSFVQNSMSYHRVMLDDVCWYVALTKHNARSLDPQFLRKAQQATRWLSKFVDQRSGRVPNYGANDGANVLPFSCSDYLDFRPVLQCAANLLDVGDAKIEKGPWDEKTLWLHGSVPRKSGEDIESTCWHAPQGGYFVLYGDDSKVFVRATTHRDRPSQCDMLHLDLWYRGYNILRDAGSYFYFHKNPEVKKYYYSSRAHNVVWGDGTEQMLKGPNFLWFNWPVSEATFDTENSLRCSAHFRGVDNYTHNRTVTRRGECYQIVDQVNGLERYNLNWRLAPEFAWSQEDPFTFSAAIDGMKYFVRIGDLGGGDAKLAVADESLYYGERKEIPAIEVRGIKGSVTTRSGPE